MLQIYADTFKIATRMDAREISFPPHMKEIVKCRKFRLRDLLRKPVRMVCEGGEVIKRE